jgi:hypothetical protein
LLRTWPRKRRTFDGENETARARSLWWAGKGEATVGQQKKGSKLESQQERADDKRRTVCLVNFECARRGKDSRSRNGCDKDEDEDSEAVEVTFCFRSRRNPDAETHVDGRPHKRCTNGARHYRQPSHSLPSANLLLRTP